MQQTFEQRADEKVKKFATISQLLGTVITLIVAVSFWLFAIKSDVATSIRDNVKQDAAIDKLQTKTESMSERMEQNQREILEKLNQIQLDVKDKQDRKQ